jgi:hypothetical protein
LPPLTLSTDQVTVVLLDPCTVALNCWVVPAVRVADMGEIKTVTAPAVTVTVALALFVVSAMLVAVTVCMPAWDGAVYRPPALIVPTVAFPAAAPSTDHVTPVLPVVGVTVAVNCAVPPAGTEAVGGVKAILI